MQLQDILKHAIEKKASDVHLFVGQPPILRVDGELTPSRLEALREETLQEIIFSKLTEKQKKIFQDKKDLDFSFSFVENYDFRINVHFGAGKIAANVRILPQQAKTREELHLPLAVDELARKRQGFIVISGTAGSGKSTTMTYVLDLINRERKCKIITIEDPIEVHHAPKQSFILQREVGVDTFSFATALKYALRQDPDVVAIGEMRDHESISMALTAAETGHLVITTVHAPDATETINRIVDVYSIGHREQILTQLSRNLVGVISQSLLPRKDQEGRILATEILISNIAIQNLIRRGALIEVRGLMDAHHGSGMHSLEWVLVEMAHEGLITAQTAKDYANYLHHFEHFKKIRDTRGRIPADTKDPLAKKIAEKMSRRILIVDPDDHTRVSIVLKLNSLGYEQVFYATNAAKGWEVVKKERPEIIVVDALLPDQDCFEFCRDLRAEVPPATRILFITNAITKRDQRAAQEAGVDKLITATSDHQFLLQALEE